MLASQLDFPLPPSAIAQHPHEPRDEARLLRLLRPRLVQNVDDALSHHRVCDLPQLLRSGDLLVFNNTRVLRARLFAHKPSGGRVEMLLLKELERNRWEALLKPSARLRAGGTVLVAREGTAPLAVQLEERAGESWRLRFLLAEGEDIREHLTTLGEVPLPPYIRSSAREEQYQTVYAQSRIGQEHPLDSAAAPTAGLHFTPRLLDALQQQGVSTCFLTLGVGAGTFRPVQTATLEEHAMHAEEFEVGAATAAQINAQKARGGRVIAVGTTTTRVLEALADEQGHINTGYGSTSIFIRPGFRLRCVDALMTNFHLPRSTLLALVAALAENGQPQPQLTGLEIVRYAYAHALAAGYRFFSFGDAMLIE
jgi:S-adenosylmethionine:tRNA ribosyltransferase-isomerase